MIDVIQLILKKQFDDYKHMIIKKKMKKNYKLSRDLMKNLIDEISFHAFSKIYKQYAIIKQIDKHSKKFKKYVEIFIIIMSFSCSHKIRKILKIEKKKLLLKNVHFH